MFLLSLVWLVLSVTEMPQQKDTVFAGNAGNVRFISDAQLEHIEAATDQLAGAVNGTSREVFFSLSVVSFHGFNSGLQSEHFNENYLESDLFPVATFKGKIIDDIDLMQNGAFEVRVKGLLTIHGVTVERIISGKVVINGTTMKIESTFPVLLADHNITIPKIVEMKIARQVTVMVNMTLIRNKS